MKQNYLLLIEISAAEMKFNTINRVLHTKYKMVWNIEKKVQIKLCLSTENKREETEINNVKTWHKEFHWFWVWGGGAEGNIIISTNSILNTFQLFVRQFGNDDFPISIRNHFHIIFSSFVVFWPSWLFCFLRYFGSLAIWRNQCKNQETQEKPSTGEIKWAQMVIQNATNDEMI